jgi:hypothetical protein
MSPSTSIEGGSAAVLGLEPTSIFVLVVVAAISALGLMYSYPAVFGRGKKKSSNPRGAHRLTVETVRPKVDYNRVPSPIKAQHPREQTKARNGTELKYYQGDERAVNPATLCSPSITHFEKEHFVQESTSPNSVSDSPVPGQNTRGAAEGGSNQYRHPHAIRPPDFSSTTSRRSSQPLYQSPLKQQAERLRMDEIARKQNSYRDIENSSYAFVEQYQAGQTHEHLQPEMQYTVIEQNDLDEQENMQRTIREKHVQSKAMITSFDASFEEELAKLHEEEVEMANANQSVRDITNAVEKAQSDKGVDLGLVQKNIDRLPAHYCATDKLLLQNRLDELRKRREIEEEGAKISAAMSEIRKDLNAASSDNNLDLAPILSKINALSSKANGRKALFDRLEALSIQRKTAEKKVAKAKQKQAEAKQEAKQEADRKKDFETDWDALASQFDRAAQVYDEWLVAPGTKNKKEGRKKLALPMERIINKSLSGQLSKEAVGVAFRDLMGFYNTKLGEINNVPAGVDPKAFAKVVLVRTIISSVASNAAMNVFGYDDATLKNVGNAWIKLLSVSQLMLELCAELAEDGMVSMFLGGMASVTEFQKTEKQLNGFPWLFRNSVPFDDSLVVSRIKVGGFPKTVERVVGAMATLYSGFVQADPMISQKPHPHPIRHGYVYIAKIINLPPKVLKTYHCIAVHLMMVVSGHKLHKVYKQKQLGKIMKLIDAHFLPQLLSNVDDIWSNFETNRVEKPHVRNFRAFISQAWSSRPPSPQCLVQNEKTGIIQTPGKDPAFTMAGARQYSPFHLKQTVDLVDEREKYRKLSYGNLPYGHFRRLPEEDAKRKAKEEAERKAKGGATAERTGGW